MLDGAFAIFNVPPFLSIEYKLFTAGFALIFSNSAMAKPMRVKVLFISVPVWTVKELIVLATMSLGMSCEVILIEERFITVRANTKEAGIGTM